MLRVGIIAGTSSPWVPGLLETLYDTGKIEMCVALFDPKGESGYTDPKSQGLLERYQAIADKGAEFEFYKGKSGKKSEYVSLGKQIGRAWKGKVDIVLSLYGGGFALSAYTSGVRPYVIYAVGSDVLRIKGIARILSLITYRGASYLFCNGEYLTERAEDLIGTSNIENLLIGVDTDKFVPGQCKSGPLKIVCPRGFMDVYDNITVIQALNLIPTDLTDWQCEFLAGGTTLEHDRQLLRSDLNARVRFRGGCSQAEMLTAYQNSDVLVSVSLSDGTSTAVLEGLSCGLIPVLSDIPANRPWVNSAENLGNLVPTQNPEKLAEVLTAAILDAESIRTKRPKIREFAVANADARQNMELLVDRLRALSIT